MNFDDTNNEYSDAPDNGSDVRRCKYCQTDISHMSKRAKMCGSADCRRDYHRAYQAEGRNCKPAIKAKPGEQVCPYCNHRAVANRANAKTCGDKACTIKRAMESLVRKREMARKDIPEVICPYCNVRPMPHRKTACHCGDAVCSKAHLKAYQKAYRESPHGKAKKKAQQQSPEAKAWAKEYAGRKEVRERISQQRREKYHNDPEHKAKITAQSRERYYSEKAAAKRKEYLQRPEVKARRAKWAREWARRPDVKAKTKAYRSSEEYKARIRAKWKTPEMQQKMKEYWARPETKARLKEYYQRPEVKERRKDVRAAYNKTPKGKAILMAHQNFADIDLCMDECLGHCIYCDIQVVERSKKKDGAVGEHIDPDMKGTAEDGPHNWVLACSSCNTSKKNRNLHEWLESGGSPSRTMRPTEDIIADMTRLGKTIPPKKIA